MDFLRHWLLTLLIFIPAAGAIVVLFMRTRDSIRWATLGPTLLTFVLSLFLIFTYNWQGKDGAYAYAPGQNNGIAEAPNGVIQMVQHARWIPAFNIEYRVGIDGLSLPLVILSTFICLLACIASWNIEKMTKGYMALFLFLEMGILGVFLSLDFFLFYVFFEISLFPMYFLIGIWGGPKKEYAAIKFFLYTLLGSIGILIVILGVYFNTLKIDGKHPIFDLVQLSSDPTVSAIFKPGGAAFGFANIAFWLLVLGFAVKVPCVPVHTWLPDAHVEAPTPISMILAAVLLKMGGYGILRICYPICPHGGYDLMWFVCILGVVSMIYGAFAAMAQTDFKRMVAYSSVS